MPKRRLSTRSRSRRSAVGVTDTSPRDLMDYVTCPEAGGRANIIPGNCRRRFCTNWKKSLHPATDVGLVLCLRRRQALKICCLALVAPTAHHFVPQAFMVCQHGSAICSQGGGRGGFVLGSLKNAVVLCVDEKPDIQALERRCGYAVSSDKHLVQGYESTYTPPIRDMAR